jgi:hypothetical protein
MSHAWQNLTQAPVAQRTPPIAGLALGLGIAGVVVDVFYPLVGIVLAIAAIVLGVAGQVRIAGSGGRLGGRGLAMAGWICGVIGVGLPALVFLAAFAVGFVTALQGR